MREKNMDRAEQKADKRLRREARLAREAAKMDEYFTNREDAESLAREIEAEFLQNSADRY